MFSGNIFGGTFNIDIVKLSMKKYFTSSKKALEDDMTQIKIQTTVKCFIVLKSVIYLSVSPTV